MTRFLYRFVCILILITNLFFLNTLEVYSNKIILNLNFAGAWEAKEIELKEECVFCTQVVKVCPPGQILVPQSCNECSHCIGEKAAEKGRDEEITEKKVIINLCIKENKLVGTINIEEKIQEGLIKSCSVIAENKVFVNIVDKESNTYNLRMELQGKKELLVEVLDYGSFKAKKTKVQPSCEVPNCCSADTRIRTSSVDKRIQDIKEGDLVISDVNKPVKIIKTNKIEVKKHKILFVRLNDGTVLEISPEHLTSDGKKFKNLKLGDVIDGRLVVEIKLKNYNYKYTYDILPDSGSGNYYANGVLIRSTLK